jgi:hypothetical protein
MIPTRINKKLKKGNRFTRNKSIDIFGTTAIQLVINIGQPSYRSGDQLCKGATPNLNSTEIN